MADEAATLSLLDQVGMPGFRASIITTYSCYLPFYEQVVLRRLVSAGCTHNVVFVDAARLGEALAVDELRPRLGGTAYTLIPVPKAGAFHPKILLQVGPAKGALFVGSHNLTLSGFGLNDELTSVFLAEPPNPRSAAAPFHVARDYLRAFLPKALPELADSFDAVFENAPWLSGPAVATGARRELLTSTGDAGALWDRVRAALRGKVSRALIVSPFFDKGLTFLRRLLDDVQPASLTVAIDPATAIIPDDAAARLPGVRFANIAGRTVVPRRRDGAHPYVHAKALWFESAESELLVTGSANASAPAFLAGTGRRNAEAVVADASPGIAESLGLMSFFDAPELSAADWSQVAATAAASEAVPEADAGAVLLATPFEDGFILSGSLLSATALSAFDQDGKQLGEVFVAVHEPVARVVATPDVRENAVLLFGTSSGLAVRAVVHRPDEIARHTATDSRKALKQALGALEDDPSQIEALLRVTAKVIFDVQDNIAAGTAEAPRVAREDGSTAESPASRTLAIEAQGRRASCKRSLARGDLAYLLDVLIRRLGEGLPASAPTRPLEEEEIGADQEHGGELGAVANTAIDFARLAKACRSKSKKLVKRMLVSLEACKEPGQSQRAVVQLAAVGGVLRALALVERRPEWRRAGHQLVDPDALFDLVEGASIAFLGDGEGLLAQAEREAGAKFEELSSTLGLLVALLFLCGVDATAGPPKPNQFEELPDERAHWYSVQVFATLAPSLALDADAQTILAQSVERFVASGRWLPDHLALAEALANLETSSPTPAKTTLAPKRGDWAVAPAAFSPRVRVILDVLPAVGGPKVVVADFSNEAGERVFLAPRVCIVPRAALKGEAGRRLVGGR